MRVSRLRPAAGNSRENARLREWPGGPSERMAQGGGTWRQRRMTPEDGAPPIGPEGIGLDCQARSGLWHTAAEGSAE